MLLESFVSVRFRIVGRIVACLLLVVSSTVHAQGTTSTTDQIQAQKPQKSALTPLGAVAEKVSVTPDGVKTKDDTVNLLVNGKVYRGGASVPLAAFMTPFTNVLALTSGTGCRDNSPKNTTEGQVHNSEAPIPLPPAKEKKNNIAVPELKQIDQTWIQQRLSTTQQAIASLNPFTNAAIISQYSTYQGITSQNSFLSAQGGSAAAITTPAPAVPTSPTGPSLPTTSGVAPSDVLTQQVELSSQILMYQAAFSGFASDNLVIGRDGKVAGVRRKVTIAIPISVTPFAAYRGAVAEVRVVLIPRKGNTGHLSVMNLLPGSNSYNVARLTTSTKQVSAGGTIEAVSLGVTAGKQRSALYLAKDMDTVSLQYSLPSAEPDVDLSRRFGTRFRNLVPTADCSQTGIGWGTLLTDFPGYDQTQAVIFGWQFKPVLGEEDVRSNPRLVMAQLALDGGEGGASLAFVETRWRQYDRKNGVVGAVYTNSCSWQSLGSLDPISDDPQILDVQREDLGSGNVRLKLQGEFSDPNLQVRIGNTQQPFDFRSTDGKNVEIVGSASTLINAPNIQLVNAENKTWPVAIPIKPDSACGLKITSVQSFPNSDGTSTVATTLEYGSDRTLDDVDQPIILLGSTAYGLRDHPLLSWTPDDSSGSVRASLAFTAKTDDLKTSPSLLLRDLEWGPTPYSSAVVKEPAFQSISVFGTGSLDGKRFAAGWYAISGSDLPQTVKVDCAHRDSKPCLEILDPSSPDKNIAIASADLKTVSLSTVLLHLQKDLPDPVTLIWTDGGQTSAWSLSSKGAVTGAKLTADPAELHVGDSKVVHFTGADFSTETDVKFEDSPLIITSKDDDKQGISVLVPTKATATTGTKQFIVDQTGNKNPLILTVTVVKP